jgi:hypothetical protein
MVPLLSFRALNFHSTLGEGASGVVMKGTCNGEPAAIKVLHKVQGALAAAMREAAAYQVGHLVGWPDCIHMYLGRIWYNAVHHMGWFSRQSGGPIPMVM